MRYEMLGSLRVRDGDAVSSISANKIEILLAALLIQADHVVTADQLMGEIWGENLPRRATAGLYVYVSELRKFLDRPDRSEKPIVTRAPGYMLRLGTDVLDANLFLEWMKHGRRHLRNREYEDACECFERGLALWRGPVLGGIGTGPVLRGFATRLTEARLECLEMLAGARLELGHHRQLIGLLYPLIAENPLREALYRLLMLALYRSERRADALKVYQQVRTTLIDELGLEPCTQLRDLHTAILRSDHDALTEYAAAG